MALDNLTNSLYSLDSIVPRNTSISKIDTSSIDRIKISNLHSDFDISNVTSLALDPSTRKMY